MIARLIAQPRIVKLCDITELSKFFFLPVQYDNPEATQMIKSLNPVRYGESLLPYIHL